MEEAQEQGQEGQEEQEERGAHSGQPRSHQQPLTLPWDWRQQEWSMYRSSPMRPLQLGQACRLPPAAPEVQAHPGKWRSEGRVRQLQNQPLPALLPAESAAPQIRSHPPLAHFPLHRSCQAIARCLTGTPALRRANRPRKS